MHIETLRTLSGPNIYGHQPVLMLTLDLGDAVTLQRAAGPEFMQRLLDVVADVSDPPRQHLQLEAYEYSLPQRLDFGAMVARVLMILAERAGVAAGHAQVIPGVTPATVRIILAHQAEQATRYLAQVAVDLVVALLHERPFPLEERIAEARRIAAQTELGPSTRAIVAAAERRGIPTQRLNTDSLVQLGYGKYRKLIQATETSQTSAIAVDIACDKVLTKLMLERAFIPVPRGTTVATADAAVAAFHEMGMPAVVKPRAACQGQGVSLNLTTPDAVILAFELASACSPDVIVEELFVGRDYRALLVGGQLVAASERRPAHVVGDGVHTIAELIELTNQNPMRGADHELPLTKIVIDSILLAHLAKHWRTLDDVPGMDEIVELRATANLSTGGTATDVTDQVHPDIQLLCERAARVIGLDICGVDLILHDIAEPLRDGCGVIEVNAAPGIRMHHHPSHGPARDVGAVIVDMLYPPGAPARVPIIAITGTNGKTTTTRMIGHILAGIAQTIGMTTTDGIWIGSACVARGDLTGPRSAQLVLGDPAVTVAVLETARGGIVRGGLGYDWADVAVLTNIQLDHLGQDGITQIEDLVAIKSLVAQRVRAGGTIVLNADDPFAARIGDDLVLCTSRRIVYTSVEAENPRIRDHCAAGGTAYVLANGWLIELDGRQEQPIIAADAIPASFGGTALFQIANALAATAACCACDVPVAQVATALRTFYSDSLQNMGRTNLYRLGRGHVLIDYGHNPAAFAAIGRTIAAWGAGRATAVIAVPGDRSDALIADAGAIAARSFDRLIIREDADRRGRAEGVVARLLARAVRATVPDCPCHIVLDERAAIELALVERRDNETIVVFADQIGMVQELLQQYGAVPADPRTVPLRVHGIAVQLGIDTTVSPWGGASDIRAVADR